MEQIGKKDYINEKIPVSKLTILGFQHVLVMYSAAVIVPIILANALQLSNLDLAFLISADLFTCGIATFLQSFSNRVFSNYHWFFISSFGFTRYGRWNWIRKFW